MGLSWIILDLVFGIGWGVFEALCLRHVLRFNHMGSPSGLSEGIMGKDRGSKIEKVR